MSLIWRAVGKRIADLVGVVIPARTACDHQRADIEKLATQLKAAHYEVRQAMDNLQGQRREHAYQEGRASGLRMALQKLRAIYPEIT